MGGYTGEGDDRIPASGSSAGSSICDDAAPLCLFAPWRSTEVNRVGTSHATPQVSAALDAVWAVWPDMDILDLRNLAFDCAENMPARDPATSVERSYSYSNGSTFTSTTNATWGHGVLSLTCLFEPSGGLGVTNPVTGEREPVSGGIFGPLTGEAAFASTLGSDRTGRTFGHGFAYPAARENFAFAASGNLRAVAAFSGFGGLGHAPGAFLAPVARFGPVALNLAGAGDALAATAVFRQSWGLALQAGVALQPEAAGPLSGSRAFRAPMTASAALSASLTRAWPGGVSAQLSAGHWRTLAAHSRSLWEGAELSESRVALALAKGFGRHELAVQAVWRSGLGGAVAAAGREWRLNPRGERGVWLTWRRK